MGATAQNEISRAGAIREQVAVSLERARIALRAAAPDISQARVSLAEARGAFVIVQLKALARFVEELEDLLTDIDEARAASITEAVRIMFESIEALHHFVEALARGVAYQPLCLFPLYAQLCTLRGRPGSELDLYFPDLVVDVPSMSVAAADGAPLPTPTERRSRFQAGLLRFLKGDDSGVQPMQVALSDVDTLATTGTQRSFWWAAQALLDALANGGLEKTQTVKRLCGRIDLELRQLCEASRRVSEPVMREMLYHLAHAAPVTERVRQTQSAFKLIGSLDYEPVAIHTATGPDKSELHALVSTAQAAWEHYAAGDAHALVEVRERTARLTELCRGLDDSIRQLVDALHALCELAGAQPGGPDPDLAQDIVSGLLLAELMLMDTALAARCSDDAAAIVQRAAQRREGKATDVAAALGASLVGAAEHRQAAGAELIKLLKTIEQGVEAAFADAGQRAELSNLTERFSQLRGALAVLAPGMVAGADECDAMVRALASTQDAPVPEVWAAAAEALAALSTQVETIGRAQANVPQTAPASEAGAAESSVEPTVTSEVPSVAAEQARPPAAPIVVAVDPPSALAPIVPAPVALLEFFETRKPEEVATEPAAPARESQPAAVEQASPPASPIVVAIDPPSAPALIVPAPVALLEFIETPKLEEVASEPAAPAMEPQPTAVVVVAASTAAPPAVVPSTQVEATARSAEDAEADEELRQIFLEEATELLGAIGTAYGALRKDVSQRLPLVEIRRSFHTLKGSSRMAALPQFGDSAWCVEKLLNDWIERGQEQSSALLDFIAQAIELFSQWVAQLHAGAVTIDPAPLHATAQALEHGPARAATAVPTPSAPPAVAPATVTIGSVVLSADLYHIFIGEAQRHIDTLTRRADVLQREAAAGVDEALLRAAHTLGGIAATAQMAPLSQLAYALEGLLQRIYSRRAAGPAICALVCRAIAAADGMVSAIAERLPPTAEATLTREVESALIDGPPDGPGDVLPPALERLSPAESPPAPSVSSEAALLESAVTLIRELPYALRQENVDPNSVTIMDGAAHPFVTGLLNTQTQLLPLTTTMATSFGSLTTTMTARTLPPVSVEQPVPSERRRDRVSDDIDAELLPVFLDEAQGLSPEAAFCLQQLRADAADHEAVRSLKRILHTLKGSARMAGAMIAGELAHSLETRIESLESSGALGAAIDELQGTFDRFNALLDQFRQGPASVPTPAAIVKPVAEKRAEGAARAVLRVRADVVDRLVNQAGEVSVARSRIEGEVRSLRGALFDLTDNVIRLRAQLRDIEMQAETQLQSSVSRDAQARFDPLEFDRFTRFQELTRGMAESVNDVSTLQQALLKAIDQSESALLNQGRLSRELQDGLMAVRMVPFASVAERLHRVVRQSAKELSKRASLEIAGAQTELDRSVLERMSAPLEHLLRNAVAHGIEPAVLRAARSKPEGGEITIELRHDGNEAHIEVRDDGGGIDLEAIARRGIERGLVPADAQWSPQSLAELIFMPGFSTAADVTLAAGRGVGMDVVKNEVSALGGRIDLEFEQGRGTRFIIRLPLALGVKRSLLMEVGGRIYALPVQIVEHVMTVKAELIGELHQTRVAEWQGNRYAFHYLPQLLGMDMAPPATRRSVSVLMLRSGAERLAVQVDRIVGIQELVSKRLSVQLESLAGINGAAVLGNGQIVLMVNPVELAARATVRAGIANGAPELPAGLRKQPLLMVVDDSLTVRKVTSRLLNRAGYAVVTAKDGLDAVNQLKGMTPAVMLVDIEMPRMDGFELTRHVRAISTLAHIPIIMVTSRDADKHRSYAFELGVNAFLGKPYQEEELLAHIARFLEPAERARAA